jgi:predicted transcriptional regulator
MKARLVFHEKRLVWFRAMKLKRVRIAVEPLAQTHRRWKKALKGRAVSKEELITVASWEVLGKVLSPSRLEILARIPVLKPKSIAALSRSLGRDFKNVYSDVVFLADLGLIELKEEGKRKTLIPMARFGGIEVDLGHGAAA